MAKNSNFFRDVGTAVFKPAGELIGGAVTALQPGRSQQIQRKQQALDMEKHFAIMRGNFAPEMKEQAARAILQSMDPKLLEKMTAAGQDVSRQQDDDALTKGAVDLGKIGRARKSVTDDVGDVSPDLAAFFDAAEKSVKDRSGFVEPEINEITGKPRKIFGAPGTPQSGKVIGTRNKDKTATTPEGKVVDNRDLFQVGTNAFKFKGEAKGEAKSPTPKALTDFFQAGTDTVPEDTIPKTLAQIGLTAKDDIQTFEEIEAAIPKLDLRQAYAASPADFQKIITALRAGKTPNGKPFTMKDAIKLITENI